MENNTKVLGYMPLLYGKTYMREALLSVIEHVEKMVILYTDKPSYGFGTDIQNPDSEAELLAIAKQVCGAKLIWHKVSSGTEGDHRGQIYQYTPGYDLVLAVDSDEVFCEPDLVAALQAAKASDKRYLGISGYINLWRSFDYACYDSYTPIRITNLHNVAGEGVVPCKIWHFSTAQTVETMRFKLAIHGHKDEIRPGWFDNVFLAWDPYMFQPKNEDLHLVARGLWNATPYDKQRMPEILKNHPFFNNPIIE